MASTQILQVFKHPIQEIRGVLDEIVKDKLLSITEFSIEGSKEWSQQIGNDVKEKLKEMGSDPNYKYCVSVVIGQLKGQGVELSSHWAWDSNTDITFSIWFANESLYWFVMVFAVFRAPDSILEENQE